MKNILVIVGSSHKHGNTEQLADAFIEGARSAGHQVTKVFLGDKVLHGCLGCNQCRYGKGCVQKDAMQEIYPIISKADTIAFASPLYFWTISAKLKAFIERLYAIAQEDHNPLLGRYEHYPQKECILLMSAADHYFWTFDQAVSYYRFTLLNYIGWEDKGMVLAGGCGGVDSDRKIENTKFLTDAYTLGKAIEEHNETM